MTLRGLFRFRGRWWIFEWPEPQVEDEPREYISKAYTVKAPYPASLPGEINAILSESGDGGRTVPELVQALSDRAALKNPGLGAPTWDGYVQACQARGYSPIQVLSCLENGVGPRLTWCEETVSTRSGAQRQSVHLTVPRWSAA